MLANKSFGYQSIPPPLVNAQGVGGYPCTVHCFVHFLTPRGRFLCISGPLGGPFCAFLHPLGVPICAFLVPGIAAFLCFVYFSVTLTPQASVHFYLDPPPPSCAFLRGPMAPKMHILCIFSVPPPSPKGGGMGHSGFTVGLTWGYSGVTLGSLLGHSGVTLGFT